MLAPVVPPIQKVPKWGAKGAAKGTAIWGGKGSSKGTDKGSNKGPDTDKGSNKGPDTDKGSNKGPDKGSEKGSDKGPHKSSDKGSDKATDKGSDKGPHKGSEKGSDKATEKGSSTEAEPAPWYPKFVFFGIRRNSFGGAFDGPDDFRNVVATVLPDGSESETQLYSDEAAVEAFGPLCLDTFLHYTYLRVRGAGFVRIQRHRNRESDSD
jgi:hypothetical protein